MAKDRTGIASRSATSLPQDSRKSCPVIGEMKAAQHWPCKRQAQKRWTNDLFVATELVQIHRRLALRIAVTCVLLGVQS